MKVDEIYDIDYQRIGSVKRTSVVECFDKIILKVRNPTDNDTYCRFQGCLE